MTDVSFLDCLRLAGWWRNISYLLYCHPYHHHHHRGHQIVELSTTRLPRTVRMTSFLHSLIYSTICLSHTLMMCEIRIFSFNPFYFLKTIHPPHSRRRMISHPINGIWSPWDHKFCFPYSAAEYSHMCWTNVGNSTGTAHSTSSSI